jgi:hypothetical protein
VAAKIEISVNSHDMTVDGKAMAPNEVAQVHIPHNFLIVATVASGTIAVTGNKVALKHVGGHNYLLTFE